MAILEKTEMAWLDAIIERLEARGFDLELILAAFKWARAAGVPVQMLDEPDGPELICNAYMRLGLKVAFPWLE